MDNSFGGQWRRTEPKKKLWSPYDPDAPSIEELREMANKAEAERMAALYLDNPAEARRLAEEKATREVELMKALRNQEVHQLREQQERKGVKMGYGNEVMCDSCERFFLAVKRCAACKEVRYCSAACQREHWNSGHKHVCKELVRKQKEEREKREREEAARVEAEQRARKEREAAEAAAEARRIRAEEREARRAAGLPVEDESEDEDAEGDLSDMPGLVAASSVDLARVKRARKLQKREVRKAKEAAGEEVPRNKKKKKKYRAAVKEDYWPDARDVQAMQEETLGIKVNRLMFSRWTDKEKHGWHHALDKQRRDVLEGVWQSFHMAGRVPLVGKKENRLRSVVEIVKFSGDKPEFAFLARRGEEWVHQYTPDQSALDKKVENWLREIIKANRYRLNDEDEMDYNTFMRLVALRAVDYKLGK